MNSSFLGSGYPIRDRLSRRYMSFRVRTNFLPVSFSTSKKVNNLSIFLGPKSAIT
ncbi:MAG: hypothetical protein ACP5K6_07085 [Dictyoglomus sp.]|uniref:hypothetical protein n=1 Tax=Dictyoglomus TaxID=13 RepID=UPI0023527F4F